FLIISQTFVRRRQILWRRRDIILFSGQKIAACVYNYPYTNSYRFRNGTRNRTTTEKRQEQDVVMLPITCLCQEFNPCGCDDNEDTTYLDPIIGDGTNLNSSLVHIGPVNGTQTVVLNGTLPNGTDSSDSSSETSSTTSQGSGTLINQRVLEVSGIWAIGGMVAATVMLL
ncbi:MAG: hypothetical protein Q9197_006622, partial [Variospora fuerteventurae]